MPIQFQCPNCDEILEVGDQDAAQPVACGGCNKHTLAPETLLSSGSILGTDFKIEEKLGEGGVALVYRAWQLSLDRPAAVKILREKYSSNEEFIEQFIREARTAAKINHPNIVQAYAVGDEGGYYYFAMEHVTGQMLKDLIAQSERITVERSLSIVKEVARGLDEAWQKQELVHRDIKPDNIMIMNDRTVKLADLGLARPKEDILQELQNQDSKEVLGTPQYISPEQLLGKAADNRSDIYSLGATLYHMLTGDYPFTGDTPPELARKHILERLPPPTEAVPERIQETIPKKVSDLVMIMMAKRPGHRFQSTQELLQEIEKIEKGKKLSRKSCDALHAPLDLERVDEEMTRTDVPEPSQQPASKRKTSSSTSATRPHKEPAAFRTKSKSSNSQQKKAPARKTQKSLAKMLVIFAILFVGGGGSVIAIAISRMDDAKEKIRGLGPQETKQYHNLKKLSNKVSPERNSELFLQQAETAVDRFSGNDRFVKRVQKLAVPYLDKELRQKRKKQHKQELTKWREKARKMEEEQAIKSTKDFLANFKENLKNAEKQNKADLKQAVQRLISKLKERKADLRETVKRLSRKCQFAKARTELLEMTTASVGPELFRKWTQEEWAREQRETLDQMAKWARKKRETLKKADEAFNMVKEAENALEGFSIGIPNNPVPGKIQSISVDSVKVKTEVITNDRTAKVESDIRNIDFCKLKPDDMAKMIEKAAEAKGISDSSKRNLYVVCYLLNQRLKMNKLETHIRALEGDYPDLAGFMNEEIDEFQQIATK